MSDKKGEYLQVRGSKLALSYLLPKTHKGLSDVICGTVIGNRDRATDPLVSKSKSFSKNTYLLKTLTIYFHY